MSQTNCNPLDESFSLETSRYPQPPGTMNSSNTQLMQSTMVLPLGSLNLLNRESETNLATDSGHPPQAKHGAASRISNEE
jgi:hypothetical protein